MKFCDLNKQMELIRPQIDENIQKVLEHGAFILGPEVNEIEETLANYVGTKHCLTVKSGTDALLLAMMALDIGPGDEVIVPGFTFYATAEMVAFLRATPVFVDVDPETCNILPSEIEKAITSKTKAIIPVDLYGQCANYSEINKIGKSHNIPIIADGAQSMGARHNDKMACGTADMGCTSFFPAKPLGVYGDGGAIFLDNSEHYEKLKQLRNHGQPKRYTHTMVGHNARMDTIQAAILKAKFEIFPREVELRNQVAKTYSELIKAEGLNVTLPFVAPGNLSVWAQYTIQTDKRDQVRESLQADGIPTAIHYPKPLNKQPVFSHYESSLPTSEKLSERVMSLPMHPYLEKDEQVRVVESLKKALG